MVTRQPIIEEEEILEQEEGLQPEIAAIEQTTADTTTELEVAVSPDIAEVPSIPEVDTLFTADEAAQFGVDIPLDWQFKITPKGAVSILDPSGWEFLDGDFFVSPEGTTLTLAQVEALMEVPEEQRIKDFPTLPQVFEPIEELEVAPPVADKIVDLETQLAGEVPGAERGILEQRLASLRTQEALGVVFPEQQISQVIEKFFPESPEEPTLPSPEEFILFTQEQREARELQQERFGEFISKIVAQGSTPQTEALLKTLDPSLSDRDIDVIFFQETVVEESFWKDAWDSFYLSAQRTVHQFGEYFTGALPNFLFPDTPFEAEIREQAKRQGLTEEQTNLMIEERNQANKTKRDFFRKINAQQQENFEEWILKHPELKQEGKPNVLETIASALPFSLAILGTTVATFAATRNPFTAIAAGTAIATPSQSQDLFEDLLQAGAPEDKAAEIAVPIGAVIAGVEAVTDLPLLKAIFPGLSIIRPAIQQAVVRATMAQLVKKGITTFTVVEVVEALEEVAQGAIHNSFVRLYDENREVFDNVGETIINTLIATLPFAIFGAGVSMRPVSPDVAIEVSPNIKTSEGWELNEQTGQWFKPVPMVDTYNETLKEAEEAGITGEDTKKAALNEVAKSEEGEIAINKKSDEIRVEQGIPPSIPTAEVTPTEVPTEVTEEVEPTPLPIETAEDLEARIETFLTRELAQPTVPTEVRAEVPTEEALVETQEITDIRNRITIPAITPKAELVNLNVTKFDTKFAEDTELYIGEGGTGAVIGDRYERFKTFLETDKPIEAAEVIVKDDGSVSFMDGRNRYAVMRDAGMQNIPVVMDAKSLANAQKFGYVGEVTQPITTTPQIGEKPVTPTQVGKPPAVEAVPEVTPTVTDVTKPASVPIEEKQLKVFKETPLPARVDPAPAQVTEAKLITGEPKLTLQQTDALVGFFADYLDNPNTITAWELTRELRRETRAGRAEQLKIRAQELVAQEGLGTEDALKQAMRETLSGELPSARSDYLQGLTDELRDALFNKVYYTLKDQPLELASTVQALTNALMGKPIPRDPGVKGGSAYTRLQRVFGGQPKVLKAIDTMAKQRKPLDDVVEGIFHEVGREPIPVDRQTADYLRNLSMKPFGQAWLLGDAPGLTKLTDPKSDKQIRDETNQLQIELAKDPVPVTRYEQPIEAAAKQIPLWPTPTRDMIVTVLKEIGWSPIDIGNFLRANKASFDFSFWRQQGPMIFNHPVAFAQSNVEAWNSIWSQKSAEASWERITRDPLFQIYDVASEAGYDFLRPLDIKKGTSQWRGVEEFGYLTGERVIPRLTMKIPWVKISSRTFVTGTNGHNWRIFKAHYKAMLKLSEKYASGELTLREGQAFDIQKEMVDMAKMLADFTQRGSLGKASALAAPINALFFAPRATLGRLLTPRHLISANPRIRIEAWRNLTTFIGVIGGIVLLGWKMGLWDVEKDPRNAEFMSIRIGNTRIDPWSGYRQFLVFFTRITTDLFTDKKGGMSSVTGAEYELNPIGALTSFIRGKASPLASLFLEYWTGKNFIGEEFDVANKKQWAERIAPFAIWDVYEAITENNPEVGAGVVVPAILGLGVQTYTGEWAELFTKLGLPKYPENNVYGLAEPFYDTQDFWVDVAGQFKGVGPATLTESKGFPEYIRSIVEAREIKESLAILPNEKLVGINADQNEGITFTQYYQMWLDREKLVREGDVEALKAFDLDERTRNAHIGNFSQRQFALLNEYWGITDKEKQAVFLEEHEAEIGVNARHEWLKSHPKDNAKLAVWGQAKILTKAAYDEFKSMIQSLDIPDNAIPEFALPPETSIDTHFAYEDLVADGEHASWEAQLLLLEDWNKVHPTGVVKEGEPESYAEWRDLTLSDTPMRALEIKVENRELSDEYNGLADKDSPNYIEDKDLREETREQFKVDNPEWVDDTRRIEAIEHDATDVTIGEWVDRGNTADEFGAGSSEAMLWLLDHPDTFKWALEQELLTDNGSDWKEPVLRINVEWAKYDEVWGEVEDAVIDGVTFTAKQIRDAILQISPEYAVARKVRDALKQDVPEHLVQNWVEYYSLPLGGARTQYLRDNDEYYTTVWLGLLGNKTVVGGTVLTSVAGESQRLVAEAIIKDSPNALNQLNSQDQALMNKTLSILEDALNAIFPNEARRLELIGQLRIAVDRYTGVGGNDLAADILSRAHDFLQDIPAMSQDEELFMLTK